MEVGYLNCDPGLEIRHQCRRRSGHCKEVVGASRTQPLLALEPWDYELVYQYNGKSLVVSVHAVPGNTA